jgi:hypothetical protein
MEKVNTDKYGKFSEEHLINFAATEYVLDHNGNDKYANEDWEQFVNRKMHDAYVAGYKKGKETKNETIKENHCTNR